MKKTMKKGIYMMLSLLLTVGLVQAQVPKGDVLIKNGTVLTITNGIKENTDVLVRGGKITQIAEGINAPSGVKVIDAAGMYVMPGIIDAHSHIAIDAVNEASSPVTAEVYTGDAINPTDISIYRALAGGVTSSHAMHGSANAIGGQNQTLKHRYGNLDPEALKFEGARRTIKFALGENPTRVHGRGNGIQPRSRMGVETVIRNAFSEAKEYKKEWDAYNQAKARGNSRVMAPAYDRRMETLVDILEGEIMVHCHSYRADEILMLMEVFKDFGIKELVFQHTNEGFKVAPELKDFGAMASVFADWWAYKFEVYYSTAYNAAILTRNGVITSINSDSGDYIRHLYHQAGKTQRYGGLTDDEALALITLNPALQLGIADRVGSIEVGKDADIAIFKGHPLSIYAVPQMTMVDGVVYFDINNDPDDMRLMVSPNETIEPLMVHDADAHNCMIGTEEFMFFGVKTFGLKN
jgi:imidazolonepropionase-like amidohydrolase